MAATKQTTTKRARQTSRTVAKKARKVAKKARKVSKATRRPARRVAKAGKKTAAPNKRSVGAPSGDALAELKQDHRRVEQLFKRFEAAGPGARRTKRALVDSMIEDLSRHAGIEELVFYPAVRREVGNSKSKVLESLEEHHLVKVGLYELERLDPSDERFDAKVTVMIENVRHHVKEEERELFPMVRARLGRRRLLDLGEELREAATRVPTRPHPSVPDEPPGNAIVGGAVAVMDRARTVGQRVVDRVLDDQPR